MTTAILPILGDHEQRHSAYPHMYPRPNLQGLTVGDTVHCRSYRESRKGDTIASATLAVVIETIDGDKLTGRVSGRLATWQDQSLLQQDGDVISFEMRNIENVPGRESPLYNAIDADGIHFRKFLLDARLFHKRGDIVKVVGGLPMPVDMMTPHDVSTGNWTGYMVLGEGYEKGMPLVVAHGYATVICVGAEDYRRDDSFMAIIASNDVGTHEMVNGAWRRAA